MNKYTSIFLDTSVYFAYNTPFSTLEMTNKAGIPWKIRKFRLFLWLKMLYIFSNLNIFLSSGLSPLAYSGVCPMAA